MTTTTPELIQPLLNKALSLQSEGHVEQAVAVCNEILAQQPDSITALKLLADLLNQQSDQQGALHVLQKIAQHAPRSHEIHSDLASQYYAMEQIANAERHVRQALALNPLNLQAHNMLGQIMARNYYFEEAVFHYRQVFLLHEPVAAICSNMGNALVRLGQLDEAEDVYRMGNQLDPSDVALLIGWVKMEEARKNFSVAWELLQKRRSYR